MKQHHTTHTHTHIHKHRQQVFGYIKVLNLITVITVLAILEQPIYILNRNIY